jgi:hypothetical protein
MGLGAFNAAEATKNLQRLAQKTGKGPLAAPKTGVGSLPVSQVRAGVPRAPAVKPAPRMFTQGLAAATKQNMETGGRLRQYAAQHPQQPKQGILGKALGVLGEGEHAVEEGAAKGIGLLERIPGVEHGGLTGSLGLSAEQRQAQNQMFAKAGVQAAEVAGTGGVAGVLRGGAGALETARAAKALESTAIDTAARVGGAAPGDLRATAGAVGARAPTVASRALRLGGAATAGYGKMLAAAVPAQAATPSGPPKKNEPFAEKFWNSAIHTIGGLPAGTIEAGLHPVKTVEGMAHLYTHPEQAWNENPAGTLLAFLAPTTAIDRGVGGLVRKGSKGQLLSTERPDLQYMSGQPQAREFQPGAVANQLQKAPDRMMKAVGKGEQPVTAPYKTSETNPPRDVAQATRMQERRDILGSRLGGFVRPGQVDLIRGGERLSRNLETIKAHQFLEEHLPHDATHATALMALHQGEARTAKTFWPDIAERVAQLKDEQHKLTGTDLAYNKEQLDRLVNMEQNRSQLSNTDLAHYERSAGTVARQQGIDWAKLNQEGIGHPDQLNARNLPALLLHGHLMGRGELTHIADPGEHPFVGQLKDAQKSQREARGVLRKAQTDLALAKSRTAGVKAAAPPGTKSSLKVGRHWVDSADHAKALYDMTLERTRDLENKLAVAKHAGAIKPNGHLFPGVYDSTGARVTPAESEAFIKEHFGREMGFLTQKQDLARARSQNSYGPRTVYPMRTGGNFMAGAYDNSPAALRNHFDRTAHNLATMRGRRSVAENLVRIKEDGTPFTENQAKAAADNMNRTPDGQATKPHLGDWVPYNLGAEKTTQLIEGHPYTKALEQQGLVEHKAILEEAKGAATWGILPKQVADRLNKWDQVESHVQGSMLRQLTTPWRQTNLYTSVRWPFGTTQENAIRLAFHQVSPLVVLPYGKYTSLSFGTGSDIVRMLDEKINDPSVSHAQKQAAIWHRSQYGQGSFAGAQIHELDPALHDLSKDPFWSRMSENPINTKGWRPYRRVIGGILNNMETNAKIAAGGKLARQDQPFFAKFHKTFSEQAAKDYVEKITTDPAQSIKAAQNLMDVMGNWNHLTPYTRQAQADLAPFALWWLNSAKFIFKTLPKDHPYATGLLAAMVTATGVENRNLKPYLEGTVPLKLPLLGEINLNPVHYSPFDIANEPLAKAAGMVVPQITEPAETAKGTDPLTGEKFTEGPPGTESGNEATAGGRVALSTLESYVPGIRMASQLLKEGGIPTKTSVFPWEAKKGSKLGLAKAAEKSLAPFLFTYVRGKKVPIEKPGKTKLGPGGRIPESRVSESRVPETRVP